MLQGRQKRQVSEPHPASFFPSNAHNKMSQPGGAKRSLAFSHLDCSNTPRAASSPDRERVEPNECPDDKELECHEGRRHESTFSVNEVYPSLPPSSFLPSHPPPLSTLTPPTPGLVTVAVKASAPSHVVLRPPLENISYMPSLSSHASSYVAPGEHPRQTRSPADIRQKRLSRTKRKHTVVSKYCEEMNELNEAANSRPRSALIHSIQQENRHIRELQRENKELHLALEEHQNVMGLIMSKYRQQITKLMSVNNSSKDQNNTEDQAQFSAHIDRINEMVMVMRRAAQLEEDEFNEQRNLITSLAYENKGLREMLHIAGKSGSLLSTQANAYTQTEPAAHPHEKHSPTSSSSSTSQAEASSCTLKEENTS